MRIKETVLGNGLSRLEVEPMCSCERNLPTHVVDEIMRDIVKHKRCGNVEPRCEASRWNRPTFGRPCVTEVPRFSRPCVPTPPRREPDGIDVHVDRPLRQNFRSHHDWAVAMAKYRTLEDVAKDCDWECREPMKGVQERPWNHSCHQETKRWWEEDEDNFCAWADSLEDEDDFEDIHFFHSDVISKL